MRAITEVSTHSLPCNLTPNPYVAQQGNTNRTIHLTGQLRWTTVLKGTQVVDNPVMHLWEVRRSPTRLWRWQKHNRQLKPQIAVLPQEAADYTAQLANTNWVDCCNSAVGQMSTRITWRLFRGLIDPQHIRTETQKCLQRAIHTFQKDTKLASALWDKYLNRIHDPVAQPTFHNLWYSVLQVPWPLGRPAKNETWYCPQAG